MFFSQRQLKVYRYMRVSQLPLRLGRCVVKTIRDSVVYGGAARKSSFGSMGSRVSALEDLPLTIWGETGELEAAYQLERGTGTIRRCNRWLNRFDAFTVVVLTLTMFALFEVSRKGYAPEGLFSALRPKIFGHTGEDPVYIIVWVVICFVTELLLKQGMAVLLKSTQSRHPEVRVALAISLFFIRAMVALIIAPATGFVYFFDRVITGCLPASCLDVLLTNYVSIVLMSRETNAWLAQQNSCIGGPLLLSSASSSAAASGAKSLQRATEGESPRSDGGVGAGAPQTAGSPSPAAAFSVFASWSMWLSDTIKCLPGPRPAADSLLPRP